MKPWSATWPGVRAAGQVLCHDATWPQRTCDPLSDVLRQRQRADVVAVAVHVASEIVATLHVTAVVVLVSAPWWPYLSLAVSTCVGTLSSWLCVFRSCTSLLLCCLRSLQPSTPQMWFSGPCVSRQWSSQQGRPQALWPRASRTRVVPLRPQVRRRPRPSRAPRMTRHATELSHGHAARPE